MEAQVLINHNRYSPMELKANIHTTFTDADDVCVLYTAHNLSTGNQIQQKHTFQNDPICS